MFVGHNVAHKCIVNLYYLVNNMFYIYSIYTIYFYLNSPPPNPSVIFCVYVNGTKCFFFFC